MDGGEPQKATGSASPPDLDDPRVRAAIDRFWRANLRTVVVLLLLWAVLGIGCGVLWADVLNRWSIAGFPLGFWFAQQGSIVSFVLIVFAYAARMAVLDRRHRKELDRIRALPPENPAR